MIYLDYNATTPIDKEVAAEMKPYLEQYFGNPSSSHQFGIETKKAVEKAREQVATLLNCKSSEIIFTSGGSEANNYAIKGVAYANEHKGKHIITSVIEHPAVIEVCKYLETKGFTVTYVPVDEDGIIKLDKLEKAITSNTILITVMHANNEIGTIQPIQKISEIAKENNIIFHTDAAQSSGKYPTKVDELGVDLLSIAGHKLYAPKGIGALYIKSGIKLEKLIHGADHESNKRAGTENVLEIVGLGKACEIASRNLKRNMEHVREMRDLLSSKLISNYPAAKINGHNKQKLPNTLSISFPNIAANLILNEIGQKGVAASAGAACHTDSVDVSSVLTAINLPVEYAMGTLRFSTGMHTSEQEILEAADIINEAINKLSNKSEDTEILIDKEEIKLTQYTQGLGCACKLRPQALEQVLKQIPQSFDQNILIDTSNSDDAAVYKINDETAIVQTVDFFTPIVDDPYEFGAIAAANALSDLYAMGAKPLFGLNIVGFPSNRLPLSVLNKILEGAQDKAKEAGINILGGHSIDDTEPKFGMVVSGLVHPNKILANSNAKEGDVIILTKPIGLGIVTTGLKRGLLNQDEKDEAVGVMTRLNKTAADIIMKFPINACTDVTGFGLLGHLSEISLASKKDVEINCDKVPILASAEKLVNGNVIPGGSKNNMEYFSKYIQWGDTISDSQKILLCDAQTSGGLIFTIPENYKQEVMKELKQNLPEDHIACIGAVKSNGNGNIYVK